MGGLIKPYLEECRSRKNCKRRRREAPIVDGKKPLRLGDLGERLKLPQQGLGQSLRNRRDFEQFPCKMEYILGSY